MLAGGGREWQIEKRPTPTTYRNAERQEVLPPPASDCHSLPEWRSSPTRIRTKSKTPGETAHLPEAGPKSGPVESGAPDSPSVGSAGSLESLVRQLAALQPAERQALQAIMDLIG